jgi:hypothetical protein
MSIGCGGTLEQYYDKDFKKVLVGNTKDFIK